MSNQAVNEPVSLAGKGQVHPVMTSDGTEVRLTHYPLGKKGPVVLAPGYGNAARAFAIETVKRNLVQYLGEHDYDVWLLDYRASPELPAARTQFTVDDIATRDWPAAISTVRAQTGADSVQVLAHCVGGASLFMGIGAGLEGVRSAVFSALAGHPIATPGNRLRSAIRLATIFKAVGIHNLSTDYDSHSFVDRAVDVTMRTLPFKHPCNHPVCRRIQFVYGDVFDHSHLNGATHDELAGIFGISNLTFFEHIAAMIRKGKVADADGNDAYLANIDRYRMPISFITGEHNRMFLPRGIELSYDLLVGAHGPELYSRHVVGGYAHLDCWLGENADRDVFPIALAELDRYND